MDTGLLPEPESALGYPESQLAEILGEHMPEFREYAQMKAHALEDGFAIYYAVDVHRFIERYVPPRSTPPTESEMDAILGRRRYR